jgi:hypothetical protein
VTGDEFVADIAHALVAAVRSKLGDWICALLGSTAKWFLVANICPLYWESLDIGLRQRVIHDGVLRTTEVDGSFGHRPL